MACSRRYATAKDDDGRKAPDGGGSMPVAKDSRVLFVVASPGDEVAGAGVWISRRSRPGDVFILHITTGCTAPLRSEQATVRRSEVHQALAMIRIPSRNCSYIPIESESAHHHFAEVVEAIEQSIADCCPSLLITHAYEGGHPDCDAASLATAAAIHQRFASMPKVLEFPLCHADCDGTMVGGEFLNDATWPASEIVLPSPCELAMKKRVLGAYRFQREKWNALPEGPEVFRPLPPYDYTRSPHCWPVWYETSTRERRTTMSQWLESAALFLRTRPLAAQVRG